MPVQVKADDTAGLIHHSDRGSQYLSIRYTERLAAAGVEASVGSVGDSYDNALTETIIGLYKTEVIRTRGPWKTLDDVEYATLEWVDWFNHRRLLAPIGNVPPAEYEKMYYDGSTPVMQSSMTQTNGSPGFPGRFSPYLATVSGFITGARPNNPALRFSFNR